jgi:type VI secretion system protein ImpL
MLSIGRLFGLIVLFLFFEVAVWVLGRVMVPDVNGLVVCTAMTGLALGVWVVYVVLTRWQSRPHAVGPAAPGAVPVTPPAVPCPPDHDLKMLIREAEDRLAASPAFAQKGLKPRLDQFPIYLVAGSPGSGKTSSLANSGLDPRLLAGESYRDTIVVPTKLCNIWYAGDAVWIDVSGRLFDDDAAWRGLLNLLTGQEPKPLVRRLWEGHRSSQNIRGLVLFCDANLFLRAPDPQQISAVSRRLQERLQTAGQVIGSSFPVYTILSKSDAIPYFGDFFNQLSDQEDRQVLGFTVPAADSAAQAFGEVYTETENKKLSEYWIRLYQSLSDKRLTFLGREAGPEKKPTIYEFPREVKRIRAEVVRFLVDTFRPNPLHPGAQLRGFYLSGVRKVVSTKTNDRLGDPAQAKAGSDATMLFKPGDLSQALASAGMRRTVVVPQETTVSRWIFLSDLFHRIVPADKNETPVVRIDRGTERYRYLAFGALAGLGLLLAIAFTTSWTNNHQLLSDVGAAVPASNPADARNPLSAENLRAMETLRIQMARLSGRTSWSLHWGLYTGDAVLPELRRLYFARFKQVFLDPILASLPSRFMSLNSGATPEPYGGVYDSLKVYRTITSGACKPDQELLARTLPALAGEGHAIDQNSDLARRQIDFYISELTIHDPYDRRLGENAEATEQARKYLRALKGPEQFYRGVVADVDRTTPPARLADYAPDYAKVLTGPSEVSGSFTRQGWDVVQQRIREGKAGSGDSCVVGNRETAIMEGFQSAGEVQNLYVQEYIKKWHEFLSRQGTARYDNVGDAVQKLEILSGYRSPMLGALDMIAENINFPPSQAGGASAVVETAKESVISKMGNLIKGKKAQEAVKDALPLPAAPLSRADVYNVFQPVLRVVNPANKGKLVDALNQNYIDALAGLKIALAALPHDLANADPAGIANAHNASAKAHDVVRQLSNGFQFEKAQGTDQDLIRYLEMPIDAADRAIPAQVDPSAKVNGQLKTVCDALGILKQREYPFNPKSESEASVQELSKLFAPSTGLIWSFQSLPQLPGLLIQAGDQWIQNPAIQQPKLTPEFLEFFNRMAHVSNALFPAGSPTPHLQYTVQPMPVEGVQEVNVTIDGVTSSTSHPVQFAWPSPSGTSSVELRLTINGVGVGFGRYEDAWAIFRLMDDAEPRQPGQNVYTFRSLRQGHGAPQYVTGTNGQPVAVRLMITFPNGFDPRNFSISCPRVAAQ